MCCRCGKYSDINNSQYFPRQKENEKECDHQCKTKYIYQVEVIFSMCNTCTLEKILQMKKFEITSRGVPKKIQNSQWGT